MNYGILNHQSKFGYGKLYYDNGVLFYAGNFEKNEIDGIDTKIFRNYNDEIFFEGVVKEGSKEGPGKLFFAKKELPVSFIRNFHIKSTDLPD